jgi:hypothetical protein
MGITGDGITTAIGVGVIVTGAGTTTIGITGTGGGIIGIGDGITAIGIIATDELHLGEDVGEAGISRPLLLCL